MTPTVADEATSAAAPAASPPAASPPTTAGAALRRAREARGLHIAALAATLKVPQSKLEALEADRYKDLPDATFARALARSMCRVLKVDAEPVLAMLPSSGAEASLDRVTPGLNQPFRERSSSHEPMISTDLMKRPMVLGVAALLVAAVAVYALPSHWIDQITQRFQGADTASSTVATGAAGTAATAGAADVPTNVEAPPAGASEAVPVPQAAASVPAPSPLAVGAGASVPPPVAAAPTLPAAAGNTTAASTLASPVTAPPPGSSSLLIKASAESWVEVVAAKGQVLLSRLLRSGDQVDVNGIAPLKLRVGNVAGTELVFRGQPVDLAARSRDNVARLELN